jgi:hypothetical protein
MWRDVDNGLVERLESSHRNHRTEDLILEHTHLVVAGNTGTAISTARASFRINKLLVCKHEASLRIPRATPPRVAGRGLTRPPV